MPKPRNIFLFIIIVLLSSSFFLRTSSYAQNWFNLPPYNILWPLWSSDLLPDLSPVHPVTGLPTPLVVRAFDKILGLKN